MSVTSGEYVLAIPDYSAEARWANELSTEDLETSSASSEQKNAAYFKKVVMKLAGDVKWAVGLVFERDLDSDSRSFSFKPHLPPHPPSLPKRNTLHTPLSPPQHLLRERLRRPIHRPALIVPPALPKDPLDRHIARAPGWGAVGEPEDGLVLGEVELPGEALGDGGGGGAVGWDAALRMTYDSRRGREKRRG